MEKLQIIGNKRMSMKEEDWEELDYVCLSVINDLILIIFIKICISLFLVAIFG
jgi:hypothetical protein